MNFNYKHIFSFVFILVTVGGFGSWITSIQQDSQKPENYLDIPTPPPQSLDALFPPASEQPVFLLSMLDMDHSLNGIIVDLMEEDFDNAAANYNKFKQKYSAVSKLVPEWESKFSPGPVEELGASLQSGDKGKIFTSVEAVTKVCTDCHVVNMVKVQQKYHWRDFESITVTDQVTNERVNFSQLMRYISMNYTGIAVNLEEGQPENSRKQFEQFRARYNSMKTTCVNCHKTQRKYYVDESMTSVIDELGKALGEKNIDAKKIDELSMKIGQDNCESCHLVHVPAAMTKLGWKMQENK